MYCPLLKSPNFDLTTAVALIQTVAIRLTELRTDDNLEKLWSSIIEKAEASNVPLPQVKKRRIVDIPGRFQSSVILTATGCRADI